MMYDPKTGESKMAKTYEDHVKMDKKGWVHEKPEIEENQADLAWGPANLALDPVEREPHYSEEDEIEPLKKRRAGANVALGE
jgi:hypothetical protein